MTLVQLPSADFDEMSYSTKCFSTKSLVAHDHDRVGYKAIIVHALKYVLVINYKLFI